MKNQPKQLTKDVKEMILSYKSYRRAAKALDLSFSYLCGIVKGKCDITENVANKAGWFSKTTWEKRNDKH